MVDRRKFENILDSSYNKMMDFEEAQGTTFERKMMFDYMKHFKGVRDNGYELEVNKLGDYHYTLTLRANRRDLMTKTYPMQRTTDENINATYNLKYSL